MLLLMSCGITGPVPNSVGQAVQQKPVVIDTACDWVKPILLTIKETDLIKDGTISRGTAAQILAHNRAFSAHCHKSK